MERAFSLNALVEAHVAMRGEEALPPESPKELQVMKALKGKGVALDHTRVFLEVEARLTGLVHEPGL